MQLEELSQVERIALATQQRREYRVHLEGLKNEMGLAQFLNDTARADDIRKRADLVAKSIAYYDNLIAEARGEKTD